MTERLRALGERASRLGTLRDQLKKDHVVTKAEVVHLSQEIEVLTKVEELFRALIDLLVAKQVKAIETVVTEGFQTIFFDQDLHFESEIGPKYNKVSIDFFIRQGSEAEPPVIRGKPLESFGGGPASIASLILRLFALFRLNKFPLLLLDETLAAVADYYVDGTGEWLKALAQQMNVPILLVTHNSAYLDHSDFAYRCTEVLNTAGRRQLQVKLQKGENQES